MFVLIAILALGLLIFVHELGHFLVAKWAGVKVERFALGFGPALLSKQIGETEYAICALPLGGYVKMHGDVPEEWQEKDHLSPENLGRRRDEGANAQGQPRESVDPERSYLHKPIPQRMAIAFAGPLFNLVFGYVAVLGFLIVQEQPLAVVGEIEPDSPAAVAGLQLGDRIVEVAGEEVRFYEDFDEALQETRGEQVEIAYLRGEELHQANIGIEEYPCQIDLDRGTCRTIGVGAPIAPVIQQVAPESPAARAGLKEGDEVVSVNGRPVTYMSQVQGAIAQSERETIDLTVRRDGQELAFTVPVATIPQTGGQRRTIGIERGIPPLVGSVQGGSPAAQAGLEPRDRIVSVEGEPVYQWNDISALVQRFAAEGEALELTVLRGRELIELQVTPQYNEQVGRYLIGFSMPAVQIAEPVFTSVAHPSLGYAFSRSPELTGRLIWLIPYGIYKLVVGDVPRDQIGGPIEIGAQIARAAEAGLGRFFWLLALISINLGILNLLPIPVLDGGHLVFFGIEAVKGSPVSLRAREIAQQAGLVALLALMVFAFYNDLRRYSSHILEFLGLS